MSCDAETSIVLEWEESSQDLVFIYSGDEGLNVFRLGRPNKPDVAISERSGPINTCPAVTLMSR